MSDTHHLHTALQALRNIPCRTLPEYLTLSEAVRRQLDPDDESSADQVLQRLIGRWPEFSGDPLNPIASPNPNLPPSWDRRTKYGAALGGGGAWTTT